MAGILWGLDTAILGLALAMSPFTSKTEAVFIAPLVSTFLHDFFSSIYMIIYTGVRKQFKKVIKALKTKSGKYIILGALLGGPIGMSGYVAAINYIGPSYTAIISAMFPALGSFFSYIFLKEKMKPIEVLGLFVSIIAIIILGYTPGNQVVTNLWLGIGCAVLCCVGWAAEAVVCAYGMKDPDISDDTALQIRQLTSAIFYGVVIITAIRGWNFTFTAFSSKAGAIILLSALFGTSSYLFYYKAIANIGPSKSMALNITYSAWSVVFSIIILHTLPDVKSIICGIAIICGSLVAATDIKSLFKKVK